MVTSAASWIHSIEYRGVGTGKGNLLIKLVRGGALRFYGAPSWVKGLLCAGVVPGILRNLHCQSLGRAYHRALDGCARRPNINEPAWIAALKGGA